MRIGVPKEVKPQEYRLGITPQVARLLVDAGHEVVVEKGAGQKIGFFDAQFADQGALLVGSAKEVYQADCVIKVKEPQAEEFPYLREGQILFCYLHLAANPPLTDVLLKKGVIALAYETVTHPSGQLPLLVPMSEIAGRISIQVGAVCSQMNYGGQGILLGGVPGVPPAHVVVIGGGVVGTEAAKMALGLGARVTVLDRSLERLRELETSLSSHLETLYSAPSTLQEVLPSADVVIGSVLLPGKRAPLLLTRKEIKTMKRGTVFVDVAIDQGGCAATSRPTTHLSPTYVEEGVIHYCVTNMPGACARTATLALTHATSSYILQLANLGVNKAIYDIPDLANGVNVCLGELTHPEIAKMYTKPFTSPQQAIAR